MLCKYFDQDKILIPSEDLDQDKFLMLCVDFNQDNAHWAKIVKSGFTKIFDKSQIFDNSNEILKLNTLITFQPKVSDKK